MGKYWRCGLAAAAVALCAQSAWAQKMNGCPEGQAMQSSDPSGKKITCVPIPDTAGLQQQINAEKAAREAQDANLGTLLGAETAARQAADNAEKTAREAQDANLSTMIGAEAVARGAADGALQGGINAEAAARQAADNALGARIDALTEADIVGTWAVSGPTSCMLSSRGFDANFAPVIVSGQPTIVTHLTASSLGTRTFNADGTGTASGTTQALGHAGVVVGVLGTDGAGSANTSSFTNAPFTWRIQLDGKLFIDDAGPLVQTASAPATRAGWTFTIDKTPPWEGYISKDKKTILLTHSMLQIETSTTLDQFGNPPPNSAPTPRFCVRSRVLSRLP